ncbi:hypothetical protein [Brachyspira sp. G79]|uniref:hypothetical protein n=1 Tax=Brachyspira sp. G79 TaxID=1358104 RepID=UPI000BBBD6D4|nr:hypothetical protein [Brachyspira sp. G79]PCG19062.1 membrane protein [Brachyspira sp. G79]
MKSLVIRKTNINALILILLTFISAASPIVIHYLGLNGKEFLPIFFALSLGAYILNPLFLIALSIISPLINYFLTNMPMPPTLYFLIFEGIVFSSIIVFFRNKNISFILLTLFAFIFARFSSIILTFIFDVSIETWFIGVLSGYKGIIVNFVFSVLIYLIFKEKNIKDTINE